MRSTQDKMNRLMADDGDCNYFCIDYDEVGLVKYARSPEGVRAWYSIVGESDLLYQWPRHENEEGVLSIVETGTDKDEIMVCGQCRHKFVCLAKREAMISFAEEDSEEVRPS